MSTATLPRPTTAANPEYACGTCGCWHAGPCPAAATRALDVLLARMAAEGDARARRAGRGARRTLQQMMPGYERQPVLLLHRPTMADDACTVCGRWSCTGGDCPPSATPAPAATQDTDTAPHGAAGQCSSCGGWFEDWNGGVCNACARR
ncbi:hypothetical protein [Streptomyces sp. bgisy100]|uniref:hypothetical protein n=1 Tax=Streptomyces sp. bgisy100 TaxID=3413783 RepID=UPI003D71E8C7